MKKSNILRQGVLFLAILAMATVLPSASAAVIGHLSVTNCASGGVTVGLGSIIWLPDIPGDSSCLQLGALTGITSVGDGSLIPTSANGTINDLPPVGGIFGFMTFGSLMFDLAPVGGFGPGSATACGVNPAIGFTCSVPGSPFILQNLGTGTSVTLAAHGTILDSGDGIISYWNGAFTTQINGQLPAAIQSTILAGKTITSSFSGEFDVSPVPEPVSMGLVGASLIALAVITRRRQRKV